MVQFYSSKPKAIKTSRDIINVVITSLDAFGQGVTKYQGKTLFVADALPGEQVAVSISEDKRHYAKANVLERFNDSPWRVKPYCPHFKQCGGCQQQHVSPDLQRESKRKALLHLLQQQTQVPLAESDMLFGKSYHYRRRARLGLQYNVKQKRLVMGFRQPLSNQLVDITRCPVLQEELEQLIVPLKKCLSSLSTVNKLGHVELISADSGNLLVLRHLSPLSTSDRQKLTNFAIQFNLSVYLSANDAELELLFGQRPFYNIDGLTLFFNPQGFIQVNSDVNRQMVEKALTWLNINSGDCLLDLFCGVGNFTLPMAKRAASVIGVEGVPALVELSKHNAEYNRLNNANFFHGDLDNNDLIGQRWFEYRFNKVLLDPARAGAFNTMRHLIACSPQSIVYVSCNPATLARDCKLLLTAGYKLKEICMMDMFPNTGHLESMILLTK